MRPTPRLLAAILLAAIGCGGPFPQNTLAPRSDLGVAIDTLFTSIFWWAVVVFAIVEGLLLFVIVRYRRREGAAGPRPLHGPLSTSFSSNRPPSSQLGRQMATSGWSSKPFTRNWSMTRCAIVESRTT